MSRRKFTVDRYEEIRRLLAAGRGVREITRALQCSRRMVRQIRDGLRGSPDQPKSAAEPLWMAQVDWPQVIHDLGLGHALKFLWRRRKPSQRTPTSRNGMDAPDLSGRNGFALDVSHFFLHQPEGKVKSTVVGIDIAKRVFQLHWVDDHSGEIFSVLLKRDEFLEHFANRACCIIGMEACGGSQHWARELQKLCRLPSHSTFRAQPSMDLAAVHTETWNYRDLVLIARELAPPVHLLPSFRSSERCP
jgi:hypothetical protein